MENNEPTKGVSKAWQKWDEKQKAYAAAFAQPLGANGLLNSFVTNPNVTGAYAEAWVRSLVKSMLARQYAVSTGAVFKPSDNPAEVPQIDTIIWDPSAAPAVFECSDFAIVPIQSVVGILEIKRTSTEKEITRQVAQRIDRFMVPTLGVIVDHSKQIFSYQGVDWFCQFELEQKPPVARMMHSDEVDPDGVFGFITFLTQIAGHTNPIAVPNWVLTDRSWLKEDK